MYLRLVAAVIAMVICATNAYADTRLALVIANSDYDGETHSRLTGPPRDAALMVEALDTSGFTVREANNLDRVALRGVAADFAADVARAARTDPETYAFIYYAGHGAAERVRGVNYLIPIDANFTDAVQLPAFAVPLPEILDMLEATGARAGMVVFDACRNVPYSDARTGQRGFVAEAARTDLLIAFSTRPGEIASDDGLFARELASAITRPGASSADAFARARGAVARATDRRQVPYIEDGLIDQLVFVLNATSSVGIEEDTNIIRENTNVDSFELSDPGNTEVIHDVDYTTPPGTIFRDQLQFDGEGPEMVVVPSGSFMMGTTIWTDPDRFQNEGPQRRVFLDRTFAVGRFEITFDDWDLCVAGGGCDNYSPSDEGWGRGRQPVINVSFDDVQNYISWLSEQADENYRLLSEAEWEYSARARSTSRYSWGRDYPVCQSTAFNGANYGSCSGDRPESVGTYQPNAFGLYDVHGNVSEYVQDCFVDRYRGLPTTAEPHEAGSCEFRVVRSGSWRGSRGSIRSGSRSRQIERSRIDRLGFRVARDLE